MEINKFYKRFNELNIKIITIIQIAIATLISLLYQFLIPLTWQPLYVAMYGPDIKHGDPGINVVIATISLWYFSFSIAWFIKRDNPYINNFLIYSLPVLSMILFVDLVEFYLWWDYIHFIPLGVDIYLLSKKRDTLHQMWLPFYLIIYSVWFFAVYFLDLAYPEPNIGIIITRCLILAALSFGLSFTFPDAFVWKKLKFIHEKEEKRNENI